MKKLIFITVLISAFTTGCSNENNSITLKDYYIELLNDPISETSFDDIVTNLEDFDYNTKLYEFTKTEDQESIESELIDVSDNIFTDNSSTLNVNLDETNDEILALTYDENDGDLTKSLVYTNPFTHLNLSGNNVDTQKELVSKLDLSDTLENGLNSYFEVAKNLEDNKNFNLDDLKNYLNYDNKKQQVNNVDEDSDRYLFFVDNDSIFIETYIKDDIVTDVNMYIDSPINDNYRMFLKASQYNESDDNSFKLETEIMPFLIVDKDGNTESTTDVINMNLFDFGFNNKEL